MGRKIRAIKDANKLKDYLQRDRYVLWNFGNTISTRDTGTIEFRGGRHLRDGFRTKRWIVFALSFIALAIEEVRRPINSELWYLLVMRINIEIRIIWDLSKSMVTSVTGGRASVIKRENLRWATGCQEIGDVCEMMVS